MITGIEALAIQATDIISVSRAAQQIVSPLAAANSMLVKTSAPANPDQIKFALDRVSVSIALVERKLAECAEIIGGLEDPETSGLLFQLSFPDELKKKAELISLQIENLKNVFSIVEDAPSWKPYLSIVQEKRKQAVRGMSNLRNAYLNIALIVEQYTNPVPTVESTVEGDTQEFASAVLASKKLLEGQSSGWL
ncbi:hypothetical protein G5574_05170 [Pantoea stewartii]|uniref:hypothetical protein n=1 Tax=Pantoea stewartii TaxID=66269 RepID=UPI0013DE1BD6|nr:hypothetical protein [Pantoea stewartii]QIE96389.1 hypothetical protein G5574_05170 [Pantoea stewartii]